MDMNRNNNYGRSREGAWIEIMPFMEMVTPKQVAPVRERGLKLRSLAYSNSFTTRRSREGAWIEILLFISYPYLNYVAPVRERGLKFLISAASSPTASVAPVRERGLK